MNRNPSLRLACVASLSLGACACANFGHHAHWAKVTPVLPVASATAAPDDGAYAAAATAIERRDYAEALDQLQAARERKPDDVRVLNAFGVVYDKLGRFDLSARYYGQAKALDPSSAIVEHNLAYSSELQGRLATRVGLPSRGAAGGDRDVQSDCRASIGAGRAQDQLCQ